MVSRKGEGDCVTKLGVGIGEDGDATELGAVDLTHNVSLTLSVFN